MNISASVVIVFLVVVSSIEAASLEKSKNPWNHRPYRPSSASNSNVNINTNTNDNTNIISSFLSQLTGNQECSYGDVYCFKKMLGAAGPAKSQDSDPKTNPEKDEDAPEEAEMLEKGSDDSKHYRPHSQPSRTSNSNFNSNSNSNSNNNDMSSVLAALQQLFNEQKKLAVKKTILLE